MIFVPNQIRPLVADLAAVEPVLPQFPPYGICVLESRHAKGFKMPPSSYDFHEVMLILNGKGRINYRGTPHPLRAHDTILLPRHSVYCLEDSPHHPLSLLCLCIKPNSQTAAIFAKIFPNQMSVLRKPAHGREIGSLLRGLLYEQIHASDHEEAVTFANTILLLSRITRFFGRQESGPHLTRTRDLRLRVQDYAKRLQQAPFESETIDVVAARLRMSTRCFTKHFKAVTGMSRLEYLHRARIERALILLSTSRQSIAFTAFSSGFDDLSTFNRVFRQTMNASPSAWRRKYFCQHTSASADPR